MSADSFILNHKKSVKVNSKSALHTVARSVIEGSLGRNLRPRPWRALITGLFSGSHSASFLVVQAHSGLGPFMLISNQKMHAG